MPTLEIDHLNKSFGSVRALRDMTFSVQEGEIFGFVGSNGAGKSTTMRIALGVLAKDSGEVYFMAPPLMTITAAALAICQKSAASTARNRCLAS